MINTLFGLLLAHILTDFVFQTNTMVQQKKEKGWRSSGLVLHSIIAGILATILCFQWNANVWWIGAVTVISHYLIDGVKESLVKGKEIRHPGPFVADQLAHLLVIAGIIFWLYADFPWAELLSETTLSAFLIVFSGILLLYRPSSVIIQQIFQQWKLKIPNDEDHLPEAGKWIGYLERTLIFIFVLVDAYTGVGFLIAAKSILRFSSSSNQRLISEYVLLGTLLSFTAAILIASATRYVLLVMM